MGKLINLFNMLHNKTSREYLPRMMDDKVECMIKARKFEFEYWDGDRRHGYGGYRYDGRWKPLAEKLIEIYKLTNESSVLDVGCGKAFLLHELKILLPGIRVAGFDVSNHGVADAPDSIRKNLFVHNARDPFPYGDNEFDLVISLGCLHNLRIFELKSALSEIERVGCRGYVMVESYRNEQELFNLQCWALTCDAFFDTEEWFWLYKEFGFTGDYEFIYFE